MPFYHEIYQKIHNRLPDVLDHENAKKFSVLLPIIDYQGETSILFQVRSHKLNTQPGEISLPGGGVEEIDTSDEMTALRETCEELGLNKEDITIIGQLDTVVTPFATIIKPFVGIIDDYQKIKPNKNEVEEVFYVPLKYFLENEPDTYFIQLEVKPENNFPFHLIPQGKYYNWRIGTYPEHFYLYEGKIIWGLTARIVRHFIQLLKDSV